MSRNILIVGVGGQGTLLASKIIGSVATKAGFDVKISETHGMAQRGGSVVTTVCIGDNVYSPMIDNGEADILLSFEQLEALRYAKYVKTDGIIITNTQKISPIAVLIGANEYPIDNLEKINNKFRVIELDALDIAQNCGSVKCINVVLLGVLARNMEFSKEVWIDAINTVVPPKFIDLNMKAFEAGYTYKQEEK